MKRLLLSLSVVFIAASAQAQCWEKVAAGLDHTLAIKPDGTLWSWGTNAAGQLGTGTSNEYETTPVQVGTANNWKEISAGGYNSLAIKTDGTLWAWGSNQFGQIGDGSFGATDILVPKKIGTATNWKSVSAGSSYSMAIKTDGTLWAWGGNFFGQLGTSGGNPFVPTQVGTGTDWKMVSASVSHTFGIKTDGTLWGWGSNSYYQLGNESIGSSSVPVRIGPAVTWSTVETGFNFTTGITTDGRRWSWGYNDWGQLGNGTFLELYDATNVEPTVSWKAIAVGYSHVAGIKSDGTLWTWGLKIGTFDDKSNVPVQVGTDSDWQSLSTGDYHTFAFKTDGSLWGWGQGEYGKLGTGTWNDITQPQNVGGGTPTGPATQAFCGSATVADLLITSGTNVQWYNQPTGGSPLASNTPLVNNGHYYATQTIAGCESLVRLDVRATINPIPSAPTGFDAQVFCSGTTLSAITLEGTNIKWYATSTGGAVIDPGSTLINNTHYFASQTINNCESSARFEVTITLNSTPAPTGSTDQTVCFNSTLANLSASGTSIQWYNSTTGGSPLAAGTVLIDQQYYYASQTVSSMESCTRLAVKATVTPNTPPTGGTVYEFCYPTTVSSLYIINGTNIKWYTTPSGGSPLDPSTLLTNGHYYASQTIGACETTARLEAAVTVNLTPTPTGPESQHRCPGATLNDLTVTGNNIKWYASLSDETPIASNTPLEHETVYYASATENSQESCFRLEIWVVLDANSAPIGYDSKDFCGSATISDLEVYANDEPEYKWYLTSSGGSPLSASQALQNNTSYFASQTVNGCESSLRHEVFVQVNTTPTLAPTGAAAQSFCSPAVIGNIAVTGTNVEWYDQPTGGHFLFSGTPIEDGKHYYAQQTITACTSASRLDVLVTVRQTPAPPVTSTPATWTSVASDYLSVAGVKSDGTLYAWGGNVYGEAGVGSDEDALLTTTLVGTQGNWKKVDSGWRHTVAIREDGTLWAWGNNEWGQLGDGTTVSKNYPVQVGTSNDWSLISSGWGHTVAIKTDGTLWAWGFNDLGQVGDGTTTNRLTPVKIGTETTWKSISVAYHTSYAIKNNGTLWGWGSDGNVLGDGDPFGRDKHAPVQIGTGTDWKEISVSFMNRFAIKNNGTLWAWGDMIVKDPTQDNVYFGLFVPTQFKTDSDWKTISVGAEHAVGIKNNGTLWAVWGRSGYGELAHPNFISLVHIDNPYQIGSDTNWKSVQTGTNLSLAIKNDGSLWGWGRNDVGQLPGPQFTYLHENIPTKIKSPESEAVCVGSTIADLNAIGTDVKWYATATGGSPLPSTEPVTVGSIYYAEQTVNGCPSSSRLDIIVLDGVAPPTGAPQQTLCPGATVANIIASGTNVKWFNASTGGTQLAIGTSLTNGATYYAEQTLGACTSSRLAVTVSLATPPAPTGVATQTFCLGATVASLTATGTNVKWYAASSGGSAFTTGTVLTNGTHYYASQTINGCESLSRLNVTASITTTATPSGSTSQTFCSGATVAQLTATGTSVKWYSSSSVGSSLVAGTILVNGTHYYATQTLNGCESVTRLDVAATVTTTALPTANATQTFCLSDTVASLQATGTALQWYSNSTGGSPLSGTIMLNSAHYFVSQTLNGCESARLDVTVVVTDVDAPTGEAEQFFNEILVATIADLEASGTGIKWYGSIHDAVARINPLPTETLLVNGATYHATQTISSCESDDVLNVLVSLITGIEQNIYGLKVYPNPVKDRFKISMDKKIDRLVAVNNLGQTMFAQPVDATESEVDFSGLASGIYSVQLHVNKQVIVVRILKQ